MNPTASTTTDDHAALPRGFVLQGRYVIDSLIGSGGMGHIYLAHQRPFNRPMAIKVMHAEHSKNEVLTQRFFQEAQAVSQLSHPNTVTVFDFGRTDDDLLFIAMEFVEGVPLGQLIREAGRLTLEDAVSFTVQIAQALGEAHQKGIIHRDLKPDNVMVVRQRGTDPFVKVLDFGIAKVVDKAETFTQAGSIVGTPHYMAPEQARSAPIDGRADLYALGCCLYEMLSGRPPYDGSSVVGILVAHQNNPIPELGADYPVMLRQFMQRAMGKDPEDRPPTAAAFVAELMACFMATPPPESGRGSAGRRDSAVGIEERLRAHARARSAMSSARERGPMSVSSTLDGQGPMAGRKPLPTPGSYLKSDSDSSIRLPRPAVSRETRPSPVPFRALVEQKSQERQESSGLPRPSWDDASISGEVSTKTLPSGSHPVASEYFERERERIASNPALGQAPTMAAGISTPGSSPQIKALVREGAQRASQSGVGSAPGVAQQASQPGYGSVPGTSAQPGSQPGYGSAPGVAAQPGSQPGYESAADARAAVDREAVVSEAAMSQSRQQRAAGAPGWVWPVVVLASVMVLSVALVVSSGGDTGQASQNAGVEEGGEVASGVAEPAVASAQPLSLDSDPSGATVVIDGVPVGRTPLTHRVAGEVVGEVRFELRGYETLRFADVPVRAEGDNRLFGVMERQALAIDVRAPRQGGVLLVNGEVLGEPMGALAQVYEATWPEGEVELVWRHPDFEDVRRVVPARGVKTPLRWEISEAALVERSEG
ncbi:protein kinase [Lujinxingia vulgaris]|uniref:non-specific serine/threonine protein kinase n=1 Tax=Lujinxingia vulgaris TaxID=2600176 RepID=A0A5C6XAE1_9DELT|nr:serine/threonine-protein kinase [Lujinxingia vulgaris]TXD34270.1 protein kinase [Lujinxingia vulgaris]